MSSPETQYQKRTPGSRKKRTGVIVTAVAVVLALIVAGSVWATKRSGQSAETPEAGGTLTVGLLLEPTNLDIRNTSGVSLDQILIDNVYQGLVGLKPNSITEYRPVLAKALPEVNAEGTEYTFELRDDVKFHDGSTLTATDVVKSLTETLTPEVVGESVTVTALGDSTVTIELPKPNSQLMWHLSTRPGLILAEGASNDIATTANGTGPYTLEQWKQGDSITLAKNADYFDEPATLDTVVFRFLPDSQARANALKDGSIDVDTALLPTFRAQFENNEDFALPRAKSTDVFTLGYNSKSGPLSDIRVREAVSRAIDTDAILTALQGDGVALGSPITELEPGYVNLVKTNAYDPESAKALLQEAGQENLELTITAPNIYDQAVLDLVTSQLESVGIQANVQPVEFSTWLERVYTNKDFDISFVDHAEARDFVNYTNPEYYFGYDNPRVQELYTQAIESSDETTADSLLQEAARIVAKDAPAKWLYNYTPTVAQNVRVHGFPEANTNSRIPLEGITVEQ